MNIICIDTASQNIGITAKGDSASFTSIFTSNNRRVNSHAAFVLPLAEYAVEQAGFSIQETEVIICPQGPGSFTGLRLAYSVAKGLQMKTQAKFYAVPVLEALAFKHKNTAEQILTIIDAKRDCFYAQLFENGKAISESVDSPAEEIIKMLKTEKKTNICGVGTKKFQEDILNAKTGIDKKDITYIDFDIENLSKLMLEYYENNCACVEVKEYDGPLYIRKSDAEK